MSTKNTELTPREKLEIMEKHMRASWEDIDNYFNAFVSSCRVDTRDAFGTVWAESKWNLFQLFGEKLRLSSSVENSLSENDILQAYQKMVIEEALINITDSKPALTASFFFGEFSTDELIKNTVETTREISGVKVNKGMKISKTFKFFVKDKEELHEIQTIFSRFLQSLEAKGTLEVSIDFFDILCMSVNDKKTWRSCHHFIDGEYGGGAFSYALDGSSAIAQIYNSISDYNVPDKIWRQMVWFSEDLSYTILSRQYPSSNPNNRKAAQDLILSLSKDPSNPSYGVVDSDVLSDFINNRSSFHYNDITCDAVSKAMVIELNGANIGAERDGMREHFKSLPYGRIFKIGVEDYVTSPYSGNILEPEDWDCSEWWEA